MTRAILGKVYLVGAGPGDPGLLTLKGKRCLEGAEVVLYDRLVSSEILALARQGAEFISVGKEANGRCVPQRRIEAMMVSRAREGRIVVRLKGGDPFIFGRGGEEVEALRRAQIPFEVVPGVSSAIAVPAYAGIPLTHREYASSIAIVTGHRSCNGTSEANWHELARAVDTLVILMGLGNLRENMDRLIEGGCSPDRPIAIVRWGTRASQRALVGTVGSIADITEQTGFKPPAVIVVGEVARFAKGLSSSEPVVALARRARATMAYPESHRDQGSGILALPSMRP